jgi:TrmH family RNA methyltransferase
LLGGPRALSLLVGAERDGLPPEVVAASERVVRIPTATDSLNAAMAATVALYELTRGRESESSDVRRVRVRGS